MAKILLVEDDSNLREIYGARLEAEGYEIVSANDGEEALATAVRERPDLIISDVMMPKISGFDMLDILRSTPETKDVRVIVMTALSQEEDRKRGEQLGADRYVVKSQVTLDDVVTMVQELLSGAPAAAAPVVASDNTTQSPQPDPVVAPPQPSDQPQAAAADPATQAPANATDTTAPITDNEVAEFVATSPLMNGSTPKPQVDSDENQTDTNPPV